MLLGMRSPQTDRLAAWLQGRFVDLGSESSQTESEFDYGMASEMDV